MAGTQGARSGGACLNCGASLHGEYCHDCGQRDIDPKASLWSVLGEFIQESLEVDGRLPRTLLPFLLRPGHLAHEFMEGRRARYTSPVRLYVFAALVSFFLMQAASQDALEAEDFVVTNDGIKVAHDERVRAELTTAAGTSAASTGDADVARVAEGSGGDGVVSLAVADDAIPERYRGLSNENLARAAIQDFFGWAPIGAIALVLALAAMLKVFYLRVPILTHVVNSTHVHSFGLMIFAIAAYTERGWVMLGALAVIQVYVFVALLKAYEQAWWATLLKYFGLVVVYWIVSLLAFAGVFLAATQLG